MRITKEYDKLIEELGESRQHRQSDRADGDERLLNSDSDEQVPSLRAEDKGAQDPKELKLKQQIEAQLNDKGFLEMLEEVAMQLLRPNFPVISVKKLRNAVHAAILERPQAFLRTKESQQVDLVELKELVISLVSKLQREVYFANRTSLYN